ncbi:hypothetical protein AB0E69_08400 [Kribbella sp. NPDC026611]|uniref:hypothetical protein n=1 Tax=Kribbella sp. NPDC026611 TaxID=3154911 RepID=UPI0033F65C22
MRRWMAGGLLMVLVLAGCGSPDQKLRDNAAQTAREALSEVNTTRLAVEQLRSHRLWPQPAGQIVKDAEKSLGKAASGFSSQQPTTGESTRLYEQTTKALGDAEDAVTAVRIALGNDDLAAAERQLDPLRTSGTDLERIGELAK